MDSDATMSGFWFLKALIATYGKKGAADMVILADRAVAEGLWASRREAVWAIEKQMGLPLTQGGEETE